MKNAKIPGKSKLIYAVMGLDLVTSIGLCSNIMAFDNKEKAEKKADDLNKYNKDKDNPNVYFYVSELVLIED